MASFLPASPTAGCAVSLMRSSSGSGCRLKIDVPASGVRPRSKRTRTSSWRKGATNVRHPHAGGAEVKALVVHRTLASRSATTEKEVPIPKAMGLVGRGDRATRVGQVEKLAECGHARCGDPALVAVVRMASGESVSYRRGRLCSTHRRPCLGRRRRRRGSRRARCFGVRRPARLATAPARSAGTSSCASWVAAGRPPCTSRGRPTSTGWWRSRSSPRCRSPTRRPRAGSCASRGWPAR